MEATLLHELAMIAATRMDGETLLVRERM